MGVKPAAVPRAGDPASRLSSAARLIDIGRVPQALEILSEVMTARPDCAAEVSELMARAALATNDLREVPELLANAEKAARPRLRRHIRCTRAEWLRRCDRLAEAERIFVQVLEAAGRDEKDAAARALLGLAEIALPGDAAKAAGFLRRALALDPGNPIVLVRLAEALQELDQRAAAFQAVQQAMDLDLGTGGLWGRVALVLNRIGRNEEAASAATIALQLDPDDSRALFVFGHRHLAQRHAAKALVYFERLSAMTPRFSSVLINYGHCLYEQGRTAEAVEVLQRAASIAPAEKLVVSNLLMYRHSDPTSPPDLAAEEARHLVPDCFGAPHVRAAPPAGSADPQRVLRLGFVSADLRSHPVAHFLESLLPRLDPRSVEIVLYSASAVADATTARLKAAAAWREIAELGDDAAAERIAADRIDVLIDLAGHTGQNRLGIFARRAAPVQVTWLGYFGTTGLPEMDYILCDRVVLPPEEEHRFTERPIRLPESYLSFSAPTVAPDPGAPPSAENGRITFGSFNRLPKLNDGVAALWARVLAAVPGSRLAVRTIQLGDPGATERLLALLGAHGIAREQILLGPPGQRDEILAAYHEVDIALDTFPFSGGTTTAEALFMGVPVVTLRGDRFAGRVSESILAAIGLAEFVAEDADAYVRIAAALAGDRDRLAMLRRTMRERMSGASFMNPERFAHQFEAALRRMWQEHCARIEEQAA
jgi:protein O-GlcNAc transferase